MESLRARLRFAARAGLLLALLALGVTLVVSAARSYRATEDISSLLDRAQAERFFRAVPELHERNRGPATAADLAKLLAQYEGEGLRYLAEYDQQGNVLAEAGQFLGSERHRPDTSRSPRVVGERVRATFRAPRPGRGPNKPGRPEPRRPFEGDEDGGPFGGPGSAPNLPDLVLELEPTVSNQLRDRASRSFAFSTAAAVALCVLTVALWLSLRREERRRERTERERHLAVLGEMSAVLAHEIRNPLASLKGNAQLLAEQLDAASPLQKKVVRVLGEAKRLEDLTTTLLDLVRSSSVARAATDPARLLREAADAIAPERIDVLVDEAPATFPLDALRMDQVLQNLIRNAIQASSPEGRVEVSVTVQRGVLVLRVRDHGPGLPEKDTDRLFEAFHTTRTRGTGLGLAIARRIVELHGGKLTAENHPEGGALFTARIPNRDRTP